MRLGISDDPRTLTEYPSPCFLSSLVLSQYTGLCMPLDSYSSMVKWSRSGGEGATLPSTLQGISVKQGTTDVPFREAACVLFLLHARSEEQTNWNKEQGKFCDFFFFFFLLSVVSALQLLKLCARKVHFNSRRVITRKIRDPNGRKMI